jgi:hypothetical protein
MSLSTPTQVLTQFETLELQKDSVTCLSVSRNGRIIAAGFASSLLRIWQNRPSNFKYTRK